MREKSRESGIKAVKAGERERGRANFTIAFRLTSRALRLVLLRLSPTAFRLAFCEKKRLTIKKL